MPLRPLISLSLLLLAWQAACAESADDLFHGGAQRYLSNDVAQAREEVDRGLKLFPDDIKLKKLDELLKQQSQQQQSRNDQQQQDQDKKDQQQKQQNQQQQAKQDPKDQQKKQGENKSQEQNDGQKSSGGKKDEKEQGEPSQPMQAHAMTPQEAQRLLDAQKGEEMVLQFKPQGKPESRERTLKDW